MIITNSFIFDITALTTAIIIGAITFLKYRYLYWKRLGIPSIPPEIPFGNIKDKILNKTSFGELTKQFYNNFKARKEKHGGLYFTAAPVYMPIDLDLIKTILQTDFSHFTNHGLYYNETDDPLTANLLNIEDEKWKSLRNKLSPTFTSIKIRQMFETFAKCASGLKELVDDASGNQTPVEIKDVIARFTTDFIGSVAFGIECNSLKQPDAEFRKYGRRTFQPTLYEQIRLIMISILPHALLKTFRVRKIPKVVSNFFMTAVKDVVEYREANNIARKDFLQLLIQLKNQGQLDNEVATKLEKGLTMNELAAQCFIFFVAGFETASTATSFAVYALATNQDIQAKVRNEIRGVLAKHSNEITYDSIKEMSYLDKVVRESLRLYPTVSALNRKCNKDWKIPNTDVIIKKGTNVVISSEGIHHDPEFYPNPHIFDPDRFSEEAKSLRPAFAWIPFGEGPRHCIGMRLALLQIKVGLITILENHKITINEKTPLPIKINPFGLSNSIQGGVWIDLEKAN